MKDDEIVYLKHLLVQIADHIVQHSKDCHDCYTDGQGAYLLKKAKLMLHRYGERHEDKAQ